MAKIKLSDLKPVESSKVSMGDLSEAKEPGQIESALRGFGQGVSLGYGDELTGAVESMFTDKTYEQARDESRAANLAAEEANPWSYGAGQVGSALVPGLGAAKGLGLLAKGGKLLTTKQKAARMLGGAAAIGGAEGLGLSEGENAGELAGDIATGVGTGLAGGVLGAGIGKAAQTFGPDIIGAAKGLGRATRDSALKIAKATTSHTPETIAAQLKYPKRILKNLEIDTHDLSKKMEPKAYELLNQIGNQKTALFKALKDEKPVESTHLYEIMNKGLDDMEGGTGADVQNEFKKVKNFITKYIEDQEENEILKKSKKIVGEELDKVNKKITKREAQPKTSYFGDMEDMELNRLYEEKGKLTTEFQKPYILTAQKTKGLHDVLSHMAQFDATESKKRKLQSRLYGSIKKHFDDDLRNRFTNVNYDAEWDDVIEKSALLGDIQQKKNFLSGGKEVKGKRIDSVADWEKWDSYIDKLQRQVIMEIREGQGKDHAYKKLLQFDALMKTDIADDVMGKALYTISDPDVIGEEMKFIRGMTAPLVREGVNAAKRIKELKEIPFIKGTGKAAKGTYTGVSGIVKKMGNSKFSKYLTEQYNENGVRGLTAAHMSLMARDEEYRRKYKGE